MSGTPHVDKTYGQIAATNVSSWASSTSRASSTANSPEAQTVGDGPVYVFSNGQYIEGTLEA